MELTYGVLRKVNSEEDVVARHLREQQRKQRKDGDNCVGNPTPSATTLAATWATAC
jgi:hypothetical protein